MKHASPQRGFTLIELMVTIAIIGTLMAMAVPNFGKAVASTRERTAVLKFTQDFSWARGAAAANDASAILAGTSGVPVVVLTVNGDCSWTTTVNGTTDPKHSTTISALTTLAPGLTCAAAAPTLPAAFTFASQGFVNNTGTITFSGSNATTWPLQILYSGSIIKIVPGTGATT